MVKCQSFYRCFVFANFLGISQKLVNYSFSKSFMKYLNKIRRITVSFARGGYNVREIMCVGCVWLGRMCVHSVTEESLIIYMANLEGTKKSEQSSNSSSSALHSCP